MKSALSPRLGCILMFCMFCAGCGLVYGVISAPRVSESELRGLIGSKLPLGTKRSEVVAWLKSRNMRIHSDEHRICVWVLNTGSRLPFDFRDIRLDFEFDQNDILIQSVVDEEPRF